MSRTVGAARSPGVDTRRVSAETRVARAARPALGPVATLALLATALLAACGSDYLLGPDALQGIDGVVLLGPQCPVVSEEDPCPDLPYSTWIHVLDARGGLVTRFRSAEDGTFRVGLRPGRYVLEPEPGDPLPVAPEQEVTVDAGIWTEVVVFYDTGIR
ncbi:MAG TPA: hypothetical protein VK849_08680 [Longimicrobiales bacterium]|nr:hypothetical protein [Longimicrobiales bacterium]